MRRVAPWRSGGRTAAGRSPGGAGAGAPLAQGEDVTVIVPAYNEAARLPPYLRAVVSYFETRGEPFEVIVVDDGSADATSDHVGEVAAAHHIVELI